MTPEQFKEKERYEQLLYLAAGSYSVRNTDVFDEMRELMTLLEGEPTE